MQKSLVISETCFADFESDGAIQAKLFERWRNGLRAVSSIRVPAGWDYFAVLYVSRDKVQYREELERLTVALGDGSQTQFMIVDYDHPPEGYGLPQTHPDLIKNPNKRAPERDRLFEKALNLGIDLQGYDRVIRIALDDDDIWLPWQLENITQIANTFRGDNLAVAIGMPNVLVCYVENEEVLVERAVFTRMMTGSKFYLASGAALTRARGMHPWGIPEVFSEESTERFRRVGIDLSIVHTPNPAWIYMRWGDNLSNTNKRAYYTSDPIIEYRGDISRMIDELAK